MDGSLLFLAVHATEYDSGLNEGNRKWETKNKACQLQFAAECRAVLLTKIREEDTWNEKVQKMY